MRLTLVTACTVILGLTGSEARCQHLLLVRGTLAFQSQDSFAFTDWLAGVYTDGLALGPCMPYVPC